MKGRLIKLAAYALCIIMAFTMTAPVFAAGEQADTQDEVLAAESQDEILAAGATDEATGGAGPIYFARGAGNGGGDAYSGAEKGTDAIYVGPVAENGSYYYYDENGEKLTGLIENEYGKWYADASGKVLTGFRQVGSDYYYFLTSKDLEGWLYESIEGGTLCVYGIAADCGLYKNYVISYTGVCYKIPTYKKDKKCKKIAKLIAKCSGKGVKGMTDLDKVSRAAYVVACFAERGKYTMKGKYYNKPVGVFYKKRYSCAGTTRALGLVLKNMGYKWKHKNKNKYKHQWCVLTMDKKKGWADGQIGMAGYGKHPAE